MIGRPIGERTRESDRGWNGEVEKAFPSQDLASATINRFLLGGILFGLTLTAACGSLAEGAPVAVPPTSQEPVVPGVGPTPDAAIWFDDPLGRFRVLVPDNWTARTGDASLDVALGYPGTNANIAIWSETWCVEGTGSEAVGVLWDSLRDFYSDSGFQIQKSPTARTVNGHAAADSYFTHFLANGKAYQVIGVILGPEWSSAWTFSGLMHDSSELFLWPDINATFESFQILEGPSPSGLLRTSTHIQVGIPRAWAGATPATIGGETVDALLADQRTSVAIVVVSEARALAGTTAEARTILQEAIDGLSTQSGFQVLEPPSDASVDGHPAARVSLTWQPSTYNVDTSIAVVVGAEWGRFWSVSASAYSWQSAGAKTCLNATLATFDVLAAPGNRAVDNFLRAYQGWLLLLGIGATAAEGAILGFFMIRASRRKP